ncbi:hypothetical protein C0Q70_19308 [Pomacea canaliculata]|uniref:Secreted protein n=1 Tax=Pomacea canaliculata TaxID=400727 RepID=A0A2T7NIY5_POMCA|nr:hypothetical protein C0Q70_19308 [Pomacea canaliculata]
MRPGWTLHRKTRLARCVTWGSLLTGLCQEFLPSSEEHQSVVQRIPPLAHRAKVQRSTAARKGNRVEKGAD